MRIWNRLFGRNKEQTKFILCIDGGGMRGIIPIEVLRKLEDVLHENGLNKPVSSYFDLIAGTSTGGLIALSLTCSDYSLGEIEKTYIESGEIIFPAQKHPLQGIFNLFDDKYSPEGLEKVLFERFGNKTLGEASKPTLIVSYDLAKGRQRLIRSWSDSDFKVTEAGRATSSAPTYFPALFRKDEILVDGGVIANNPSVLAYIEAKKLWPECKKFVILSLSTAAGKQTLSQNEFSSGLINWADKISPMYITAQKDLSDHVIENMNDAEYVRIDGHMEKSIKMDDASPYAMNSMYEFGCSLANSQKTKLEHVAELLKLQE